MKIQRLVLSWVLCLCLLPWPLFSACEGEFGAINPQLQKSTVQTHTPSHGTEPGTPPVKKEKKGRKRKILKYTLLAIALAGGTFTYLNWDFIHSVIMYEKDLDNFIDDGTLDQEIEKPIPPEEIKLFKENRAETFALRSKENNIPEILLFNKNRIQQGLSRTFTAVAKSKEPDPEIAEKLEIENVIRQRLEALVLEPLEEDPSKLNIAFMGRWREFVSNNTIDRKDFESGKEIKVSFPSVDEKVGGVGSATGSAEFTIRWNPESKKLEIPKARATLKVSTFLGDQEDEVIMEDLTGTPADLERRPRRYMKPPPTPQEEAKLPETPVVPEVQGRNLVFPI